MSVESERARSSVLPVRGILLSLLVLGTEDYTGLWDALFEVQVSDRALTREDARVRTAQLLDELARLGLVEIYSAVGGLGRTTPTLIDRADHLSVLSDAEPWRVPDAPSGEPLFYYLARDRGDEIAREEHFGQ